MDLDGYERRAKPAKRQRFRFGERLGLVNATARVEPCACGGEVVATRLDDDNLTAAVWAHQHTLEHIAWRNRAGLEDGRP